MKLLWLASRSMRVRAIVGAVGLATLIIVWCVALRVPFIAGRPFRIGFEENPPVQIHTASGFSGLSVETVGEAAKRAGIRLQWVETGTSSEEALRKGLVDLWPLMVDMPDRRRYIHFARPWMRSNNILLLREGTATPDRSFRGHIAVFKMPLHVRLVHERFPEAQVLVSPTMQDVLKVVCTGAADAAYFEARVALSEMRDKPQECALSPLRIQPISSLAFQAGVASTFKAAAAADRIQREIDNMYRDGTLASLIAKYSYFGLGDTWAAYELMRAEERWRWFTWVGCGLMFASSASLWMASSLRQRKRAEMRLRESEERFRNLANTAPVMIWVTDLDGLCTFVNRTWLNFTGRTLEEELGIGWAACVHPDDRQRNHDAFRSAFDARQTFQVESRWRRADGEYRLVLCTGVPRFASGGNFVGYIGSKIDVTDLQSEKRFRQLAENIDEVFWMLDIGTEQVLYVSPAFERIWGISSAALYQNRNRLIDAVHAEDRDRCTTFFSKLKSEPVEETYRIVRPNGSIRWIHDRAFLVYDPEGKPYRVAGIAEDVTTHRELEEALRQAYKMEAIGRLAGGIAHDFNNLLTVVGGYLHLVLDATQPSDPRHEKLTHILAAFNRASMLTSQLLSFTRKQMIRPKSVNVNKLLGNMEALLRPMLGEYIQLVTDLGSDLPCVKADPNQLEQVAMNLAANARDAMPKGGEFRIRTALGHTLVQAGSNRDIGPCVCIQMSDTGCGMSPDVMEHAFEPFFTTKGVGKGTGLGLSTVYGIIQQNHGAIHVSSSPGRGTTFEILLPVSQQREEASFATSPPEKLPGTETILVAEDEPGLRKLVCETLNQLGYSVLLAEDGREALRLLEEQHRVVDVILTDVIMPKMGGPELAKRVRALSPGTKIIYMSGYTDDTLASYGPPQPDTEYLQKPFTPAGLAEKLRQVLSTGPT